MDICIQVKESVGMGVGPVEGDPVVDVWAGSGLTGWWRSGVSAAPATIHLIVPTHAEQSLAFPWPGTIIFVSSKEFGALGQDGWSRREGAPNGDGAMPP